MNNTSEIYLSVIISAYNEAAKGVQNLDLISSYLQKQGFNYEIIVINDGSKDRTADAIRNIMPQIPNLKFINREINMGKGYGVREGMLAAKGKIRLFMDMDNSTDISYFDKMRPFFDKGCDIVISTRDEKDAPGAGQKFPQPWVKRQMGNMGNVYIQVVAGLWGIWDTQNGFKAFRDYAAERIFKKCTVNRWTFDVETLVLAKKFGYKIATIPVMWINEPLYSRTKLSGYLNSLLEVAKIRWNLIRGKYDEKQ